MMLFSLVGVVIDSMWGETYRRQMYACGGQGGKRKYVHIFICRQSAVSKVLFMFIRNAMNCVTMKWCVCGVALVFHSSVCYGYIMLMITIL